MPKPDTEKAQIHIDGSWEKKTHSGKKSRGEPLPTRKAPGKDHSPGKKISDVQTRRTRGLLGDPRKEPESRGEKLREKRKSPANAEVEKRGPYDGGS